MQFLYSAFSLPKLAESALHIIYPWQTYYIHHRSPPWGDNLLQGVAGNPGTIVILLSITRYSFMAE